VDYQSEQTHACRFWPEIYVHLTTNPFQPHGKIVPVRPGRQDAVLKHANRILYECEVDLASSLLHGPINFDKDGRSICEPNNWAAMITKAPLRGMDTDNANSVEPL
jgi:hypothetical protein